MTVKQLIEKLQNYPENLEVRISSNGDDAVSIDGVVIYPWMYEDSEPLWVEIYNEGDSEVV